MSATARTRAWMKALGHAGARKSPRRIPRQQPPDRLGKEFGRALARVLDPIVRAAFAPALLELRPLVEAAAAEREAMLRHDAPGDAAARRIMDQVSRALAEGVKQIDVEALAARTAAQVAAMNREQLSKQTRAALGVDVPASDRRLPALIDAFTEANVGLIKGLTDKVAADVEGAVVNAVQDGAQWGTLADDLEKRIGLPAERAELIARDQVGKLYGQINAARQREIGVRSFTWRCVDDERVRGKPGGKYPKAKPSHWARHDKVYSYDAPPDGELPGEPILCRCTAEPIFDDLLGEEDEEAPDETAAVKAPETRAVTASAPAPAPRYRYQIKESGGGLMAETNSAERARSIARTVSADRVYTGIHVVDLTPGEPAVLPGAPRARKPKAPLPPPVPVPEGFKRGVTFDNRAPVVREVPTYQNVNHRTAYVLSPTAIADRLVALPGGGEDEKRLERVRQGFRDGHQFSPVRATVLPDGRLLVEDGRHRLIVAAEQGREVLMQIEQGNAAGGVGVVPLLKR